MNVLLIILLVQFSFLLVGVSVSIFYRIELPVVFPTVDELLTAGLATLSSIFLLAGGSVVQSQLGFSPISGVRAQESVNLLIGIAAVSVILAPATEELLFRGAIQGGVRSHFGAVVSIMGSSALLGTAHVLNYSGTALEVFSAVTLIAIVSIPFAISYELTKNLVVPIASHALHNSVVYALVFSTL